MRDLTRNALSVALAAVLALAPLSALAQGHGKGHGDGDWHGQNNGKSKGKGHDDIRVVGPPIQHWNPAPPKKNGRHDNRNWNKKNRSGVIAVPNYGTRRYSTPYGTARRYSQPYDLYNRRQQTKNEWRNIAIGAGLVSVLGLLSHDSRLVFAGGAGALYSLYRYEQDRKSQNNLDRARAYYFTQPYFYREGVRYDRRIVTRDGQRYYQFVRR